MALSKFEKDMAIISALDDEPNDVGGLSAADLKAKFDEGGQAVKDFINDTLEPDIERELEKKASVEDLQGITLGQIPDGTITAEKLAPGAVDSAALSDNAVTAEKIAEGVIPDSYTKAETLTEETAKLYGKDETSVPNDILFQIRLELLGKVLFTVKVLTQNGNPLPNIEIHNMFSESGEPVKTNSSGIATGFVSPGSVELGVLDYADIQDFKKEYDFEKGKKYADEWTVKTRNFVKYIASGRTRFSSNVTNVDVSVGGAGGGGATRNRGENRGGCAGGGGGYCKTNLSVPFEPDKYEDIIVGSGGEAKVDGGSSSFLGVLADGGKGAVDDTGALGNGKGGNAGDYTTSQGTENPTAGGSGSGTVFSSYTDTVSYGGGGGGGGYHNTSGSGPNTMGGASGGSPAGGKGGSVNSASVGSASNGIANRGGGGGGSAIVRSYDGVTSVGTPGKGSDGVVAVRMTISVE